MVESTPKSVSVFRANTLATEEAKTSRRIKTVNLMVWLPQPWCVNPFGQINKARHDAT